jgi:ectoine hydroxylase-related dioxygenase (phytanoyl-CoA dioxygenase family)
MIDCPAVVSRLRWMLGSGFGVATGVGTLYGNQGDNGIFLHAGGAPLQAHSHATLLNGRLHSDYINVSWALADTAAADGGYCTIPGSHKASMALPGVDPTGERRFAGQGSTDPVGLSVNPSQLMRDGCLRHVALHAGDVVLFLGAAATHGAMTWRNPRPRRQILWSCYSRASMASLRSKL